MTLPEKILRAMDPADRKAMGRAGLTRAECQAVADRRAETALQKDMRNELAQRNLFFVSSRMDKRTTLPKGMPDFFIFPPGGRSLAVEAKVHGGDLSPEQRDVFTRYWQLTGQVVHIVWNFHQFCELLEQHCR